MDEIDFEAFLKVDMRIGEIVRAEKFAEARKPAIKLWIDFGLEIGHKKTSAQITENYTPSKLIGKKVVAVVNFPPKQIANFKSEVLVLGVSHESGVILLTPDQNAEIGQRVH